MNERTSIRDCDLINDVIPQKIASKSGSKLTCSPHRDEAFNTKDSPVERHAVMPSHGGPGPTPVTKGRASLTQSSRTSQLQPVSSASSLVDFTETQEAANPLSSMHQYGIQPRKSERTNCPLSHRRRPQGPHRTQKQPFPHMHQSQDTNSGNTGRRLSRRRPLKLFKP